jgi:3-phosphoinositide dependent protein kinase-1
MTDIQERSTAQSEKQKKKAFSKDDFEFGPQLGEGAFSKVILTTFKHTGKKYATKVIQKQLILRENKIKTVKMEKQVLHMMDHPNIIKLFCTYQDKDNLYFALELAPGGELFSYISKYGPLSIEAARFYTAEIVNGLEYMHGLGIIHRDLKPGMFLTIWTK